MHKQKIVVAAWWSAIDAVHYNILKSMGKFTTKNWMKSCSVKQNVNGTGK